MKKIILVIGLLLAPVNFWGEMSKGLKQVQNMFKASCMASDVFRKVVETSPKGIVMDLAQDVTNSVTNISNIGFNVPILIGDKKFMIDGKETPLNLVGKRFGCLVKGSNILIEDAKKYDTSKGLDLSAGCPGVGCVDTGACFALTMRDLLYIVKPFMENLAGKVVLNEKGEATNKMEMGLFLSFNDAIGTILKFLIKKGVALEGATDVDKEAAKSRKLWSSLAAQLELFKKFSDASQKVAEYFAETFRLFVEAFDVVALIIGGMVVLDFIVIPPAAKNVVTVGVDEKFGNFDFDFKTIDKDFDTFFPPATQKVKSDEVF